MGLKGAAPREVLRGTGDGPSTGSLSHRPWPLGVRGAALAGTVLALLAVVAFGVTREATTTGRTPSPTVSHPAAAPPKPAFTRAEEAYIQALWPIHGEVERSAVRMSLGKIFYKINDMGKAELKTRADDALATYRRAVDVTRWLWPGIHCTRNLAVVWSGLCQQSECDHRRYSGPG